MKHLLTVFSFLLFLCANLSAQNPEPLRSLVHSTESITATIWNDGFIGQNPVSGRPGTFSWKGTEGIYTAGIVYGTSNVGAVNGSFGEGSNYIDDWRNVESNFAGGFSEEIVGTVIFDQVSTTKINDAGVLNHSYGLGFNVLQKSYSKSDENVIFFRYGFINTTGEDIADLYVGHTTDWDIGSYNNNAGGIDHSINLTYISRTDSTGPYFGVVVIDSLVGCKLPNHIPSNLRVETFNYISIFDSNIPTSGNLNTVGGTYVDSIPENDIAWVTLAYVAGDDFDGLRENAVTAFEIARNAGWTDKIVSVSSGETDGNLIPQKFALSQNYPNPFNPNTTIKYSIPSVASGFSLSNVTLKVYDILGREVATLVNEQQKPGYYEVQFTSNNVQLTSGVYFYRIQAGDFVETKKMILLR